MRRFVLILDFEANCNSTSTLFPQEIIEFPIIAYDTHQKCIISIFHKYCKTLLPLTEFCTNLTGITQSMVDDGEHFVDVLHQVDIWLNEHDFLHDCEFITCGNWDLSTCLPSYCKFLGIKSKSYFKKWLNIKTLFREKYGKKPNGMMAMLDFLHIKHIGHHHSGLDD